MLRRNLSVSSWLPTALFVASTTTSSSSSLSSSSSAPSSSTRGLFTPTRVTLSLPTPAMSEPGPAQAVSRVKDWLSRSYHLLTGRHRGAAALKQRVKGKNGIQKAAAVIVVAPQPGNVTSAAGTKGVKYDGEKFRLLFVSRTTSQTHTSSLGTSNYVNTHQDGDSHTVDANSNASARNFERIAHSSDKIYDFPGGRVEPEDVVACDHDRSLLESLDAHIGTHMPWIPERVTVVRELADELGIVLDHQGNLRSRKFVIPTNVCVNRLVPFWEQITPLQDGDRRLDVSYFLLQVKPDTPEELEFTPKLWGRSDDVIDSRWLTVEEALNEHNRIGSGFKLAPFTQFILHHLGQFPTTGSLFSTSQIKYRNDLLEMIIAEPFVDTTDGNYNMHFPRQQMPDMPCGKHVIGSLGFDLPPEYRLGEGAEKVALESVNYGNVRASSNASDMSKNKETIVRDFGDSSYSANPGKFKEGADVSSSATVAAGSGFGSESSASLHNSTVLPKKKRNILERLGGIGSNETSVPIEEVFGKSMNSKVADLAKSVDDDENENAKKEKKEAEEIVEAIGDEVEAHKKTSDKNKKSAARTATSSSSAQQSQHIVPQMIVHIGSPLMQATNQIHQEYYNRIIQHRRDNLVASKWSREESRRSTKWD